MHARYFIVSGGQHARLGRFAPSSAAESGRRLRAGAHRMKIKRPQRLNLAIARHCYVACRGCYQFFGRGEPDLTAIEKSVACFVNLGITAVTLSGGDPLTLVGLEGFL